MQPRAKSALSEAGHARGQERPTTTGLPGEGCRRHLHAQRVPGGDPKSLQESRRPSMDTTQAPSHGAYQDPRTPWARGLQSP